MHAQFRSGTIIGAAGEFAWGPIEVGGGGAGVWTDLHSRRRQAGGSGGKWAYRRLSARIAANDVTGLTDSLRGGLHIEHAGNRGGSLYTTGIVPNERARGEETRTLTDYYTSNMDLRGGPAQ